LRAQHLFEFVDEELAILRHQEANALKLARVLPHVQRSRLKADLAASLFNTTKRLLPLMQVKHAVFSNIDCVEQVLNDRVGGHLFPSELVGFCYQLAKVSESDATILFSIKLHIRTKQEK